MQDALGHWISSAALDPDETFLYCCFFCNNQYRILVDDGGHGAANLEEIFQGRLSKIGRVVALLDTWKKPLYLTRLWTIFEQFSAIKLELPVKMSGFDVRLK